MENQGINEYLVALIEEKGTSVETEIGGDGHIGLTYEVLIEFIESVPVDQQEKIRNTLVMIDFQNGDVFHYLNYLKDGMIKAMGLD